MKLIICLILMLPAMALAQDSPPAAGVAAPAACTSEQHRQFDFWVGRWDVTANGQPAGHNDIRLIHGDCALSENWTSASAGFTGSSLNMYDQASGRWHQTWVDTTGTLLELNGSFTDGQMVLKGTRPDQAGNKIINRITFTPNADGTVRQHWETSPDGTVWTTAFDGMYHRVEAPQ